MQISDLIQHLEVLKYAFDRVLGMAQAMADSPTHARAQDGPPFYSPNSSPDVKKAPPESGAIEVSQLNKPISADSCSFYEEGEDNYMQRKLKHGEGFFVQRTIQRKKGGVYKYYYGCTRINGVKHHLTAKTQEEIIRKIKFERMQYLMLGMPPKPKRDPNDITLETWYKKYFKTYRESEKFKEKTKTTYCRQARRIMDALGSVKIKRLTELDIKNFLNTVSEGQRDKFYDIINAILKKAVANRIIDFNPCAALKRPRYKQLKFRAYQLEEQNYMLEHVEPPFNEVFYILCCTGLRIGEFLALTKDDIFENYVLVNKNKDSAGNIIPSTKTGESRRVTILPGLFDYMPADLIATFRYNVVSNACRSVYKKFGNVNLHGARHTFASMAHFVGIDDKKIQRELGHTTLAMTTDVYTDIIDNGAGGRILEYFKRLSEVLKNRF